LIKSESSFIEGSPQGFPWAWESDDDTFIEFLKIIDDDEIGEEDLWKHIDFEPREEGDSSFFSLVLQEKTLLDEIIEI